MPPTLRCHRTSPSRRPSPLSCRSHPPTPASRSYAASWSAGPVRRKRNRGARRGRPDGAAGPDGRARPGVSQDWVRAVPGDSVRSTAGGDHRLVLDAPGLRLRAELLAALDEEASADLVVEVLAGGLPFAASRTPVRVLAGRQWVFDPAFR